ncbi:hypothetical protein L9F63_024293 [Diploptera punctata]|uniref:Uncharacterized protein n=1 Tax=Diploptera punctata TaxID=6984 RepID=A0AAD8E8G5_DIPPU|nr:hypothetical protein L9F63_024293 [Diploptera punctata]
MLQLSGRPQNASPRPSRDQGSSFANKIIEGTLSRGISTTNKPAAPRFLDIQKKEPTLNTGNTGASERALEKPKSTSKPKPNLAQQQQDLAILLKLLENMDTAPTKKPSLSPSEQLLVDFLEKQATSHPAPRNVHNQLPIQNVVSTKSPAKTAKKSQPPPTNETPGRVLSELFGPVPGTGQSSTKIRDPRAGQGLVEAAINATKAVSQLMGSVLQGATKSFQSFMKSLAWGSQTG